MWEGIARKHRYALLQSDAHFMLFIPWKHVGAFNASADGVDCHSKYIGPNSWTAMLDQAMVENGTIYRVNCSCFLVQSLNGVESPELLACIALLDASRRKKLLCWKKSCLTWTQNVVSHKPNSSSSRVVSSLSAVLY